MNVISPTTTLDLGAAASAAPLADSPNDIRVYVAAARVRVEETLLREIEAMVLFALESGLDVPPEALARQQHAAPDAPPPDARTDPLVRLAALHQTLTQLIAPARGSTLVLLAEQRRCHSVLHAFGPVPQVRWMLASAVLALLLLLGTALSGDVNPENVSKGLLNLQGHRLIAVELFLVAASAVGATLANLKRLNRYISECNYDPRYDSSYWTRLVMGLISGVILSQVVFGALVGPDGAGAGADAANSPVGNALLGFGQPILAILGGFSADLVHDVLTHLIGVIGNALGLRKPQ
jgi:hypothetical protein